VNKAIGCLILFCSLIARAIGEENVDYDENPGVITVETAIKRALSHNRDLLDAKEQLRKADIRLIDENALFFWEAIPDGIFGYTNAQKDNDTDLSYGIGISLSKKFSYGTKVFLHPSVSKKGDGFQAALSGTVVQPLFKGFAKNYALNRIYGAKFSRRGAYRQFFIKQIKTVQDTIKRIYNVAKQGEIAKLNEESINRLTRQVKTAQLKETVGLATATDIYRAEHELKNAEERYNSSLLQIKDAKDRVREILSLPCNYPIEVSVPVTEFFEEYSLEEAIAIAMKNRTELDQAVDALAEAKRLSKIDKQDILPELNLVLEMANFSYYDSFRVIKPDNIEKYWKVGLTTTTGLVGQAKYSRFAMSRMAIEAARRNVERIKDVITREVKQSRRTFANLIKKIDIQKKQLKLSEMNLNLSSLKFNRGFANNFDLIEAEKNLQREQVRLFTQTIDQMVEFINVKIAMGLFCQKPTILF